MYGDSDVELETSESISEYSDISSVSAPSTNDSELGDLLDIPLTYFNIVYFSKDDIINAVDSYHRLSKIDFQIVESNYYFQYTLSSKLPRIDIIFIIKQSYLVYY